MGIIRRDKLPSSRSGSLIRRLVWDNLIWLLGSLLLAVMVWYAAVSTLNPVDQQRFSNPVTISLTPDSGMMVVHQSAQTALVTVRALKQTLDELTSDDVNVMADLSNLTPGQHTIDLKASLLRNHHGQVLNIQPAQIIVELAKRDEKLIKISVPASTQPPVGFYIFSATPDQPQAKVSGPENKVKQVTTVQAQIDTADRRARFSTTVVLVAVDANDHPIDGLVLSPAQVTVDVDIQERPDGTVLQVIPTFSGDLPTGYLRSNYTLKPDRVFVRGDSTVIRAMQGAISTEAIDLTGQTQNFKQTVKLIVPNGVSLPDPTDITVTVEIRAELISRTFANIPIQPQGLDPADYTIIVTPERVNITITGPRSVVDALTASDISVFAPLTGLSAGTTHAVVLQASVAKPGIESQNIAFSDARAEVTITARHPTPTPTPAANATLAATP